MSCEGCEDFLNENSMGHLVDEIITEINGDRKLLYRFPEFVGYI